MPSRPGGAGSLQSNCASASLPKTGWLWFAAPRPVATMFAPLVLESFLSVYSTRKTGCSTFSAAGGREPRSVGRLLVPWPDAIRRGLERPAGSAFQAGQPPEVVGDGLMVAVAQVQ